MRYTQYSVFKSGASILKILTFIAVTLLAIGFRSNAEAYLPGLEIELPDVQGWQIEASKITSAMVTNRGSVLTCQQI